MWNCKICGEAVASTDVLICDICANDVKKMNEIDEFWNEYDYKVYKFEEKERYAEQVNG